jgi:uncharacterized membrane protein YedE/YeeE
VKRQLLVAFGAGLLFSVGLCLSGMTNPARIIGFLDVFGDWDPSLAFVMAGAVGVHAALYRLIIRRTAPLLCASFSVPGKQGIDAPLLIGAATFGVGWGLAGYCPGPAVTSLASGAGLAVIFTAGMVLGFVLSRQFAAAYARRGLRVAAGGLSENEAP